MTNKISVELVKKLREETGAGVMDCKRALEEAKKDLKKAKEILKKKGLEKADKKKEREVKTGYVATYTHSTGTVGAMVEVFCETDFVARNEEFVALAKDLCLQVAAMGAKDTKELLKQDFIKDGSVTVTGLVDSLIAKFGENIVVGKIFRSEI
jgi:elongation factor Ts